MERIEYQNLPRAADAIGCEFPPGPWNDEPDKVQWPSDTGLPCMIRRGGFGAWCGYVGVPPGHPLHGLGYSDVDVDVHGGLTYAAPCDGNEETGICHVPGPGEPDPVWWFGFDCGHAFDLMPGMPADLAMIESAVYRDVNYVTAETERLAKQLADLS